MTVPPSTFDNGHYLIIKVGNDAHWGVYEKEGGRVYSLLSPPGKLKSKPAAIKWLWDMLKEEHDLSKADDPPFLDDRDV